jgi:hypothetical protein
MRKSCEQAVEKMGKVLWQSQKLYTYRAHEISGLSEPAILYTKNRTGFAQFFSAFTQAKMVIFNLLIQFLYPVSTMTINTNNLIKE